MVDLSDFKRGQIVGARMVGASVTKTAQMFGVSKVKIASEKEKNVIFKAQVWLKVKVVRERLSNFRLNF